MAISTYLSTITLKVYMDTECSNQKTQGGSMDTKTRPVYMLIKRFSPDLKEHTD